MKKAIKLIAASIILFASCKSDVVTPQTNNSNGNSNTSTVITGDFVITKFTDINPNEDKTADFNGYNFTFTTDGKINALKNGTTTQGSYTKKPTHEGEGAKLAINFSDAPLNELNKNWQINLITDSAIHLADDDASSNGVLEFTAQ